MHNRNGGNAPVLECRGWTDRVRRVWFARVGVIALSHDNVPLASYISVPNRIADSFDNGEPCLFQMRGDVPPAVLLLPHCSIT